MKRVKHFVIQVLALLLLLASPLLITACFVASSVRKETMTIEDFWTEMKAILLDIRNYVTTPFDEAPWI